MKPDLYKITCINNAWLATMPKPVAGEWLEESIVDLKSAAVDIIVSLLMPDEVRDLELSSEALYCDRHGIDYRSFPIIDRGVPQNLHIFAELAIDLYQQISSGKNIAIHCRAGIGRSSLLAASILMHHGIDVVDAFTMISAARGVQVPDTEEQHQWLVHHQKKITSTTRPDFDLF